MTMETTNKISGGFLANSLFVVVFCPAVVLLLAGDATWVEGWIFSLWLDAMVLSNYVYLYLKDPALLAERSKMPATGSDNQKGWDKYAMAAIGFTAIAWFIVMPLDAKRFGWSPVFPLWIKVLGGVILVPALYFIYRATVENTFLSTEVRIQAERKQHVVSTGVYGFVRHPLYLGCMLMMFGAPLLLGSLYGFLISIIGLVVLMGRIIGEEKMLVSELEGYGDYTKKVKYRLLPFVW